MEPVGGTAVPLDTVEGEVLELINQARGVLGCDPVDELPVHRNGGLVSLVVFSAGRDHPLGAQADQRLREQISRSAAR